MRGERGEARRQELVKALRAAGGPVLGADLAIRFNVSRQVLVQDMAILRAAGIDVIATPRGYLLRNPGPAAYRDVLHLQHDRAALGTVLTTLVDLGVRVLDISIDHPIYGAIRADLHISSRQDVQEYIQTLDSTGAGALSELTNGRHSLQVDTSRQDLLDRARNELKEKGHLL